MRDVGPWVLGALDALTDLVVVIDEDWRIVYANHYAVELLGHPRQAITGRAVSDFVHPDDLARAIEVMGRISERDLGVDTTPAMYRLHTADGSWRRVELNASLVASPVGDLLVVVGRYSGDHDLHDRLMELFTADAPTAELVALVPEFGWWREPDAEYAVFYLDDEGCPAATGADRLLALGGLDDPDTLWARVAASGEERLVDPLDLAGVGGERAAAAGFSHLWAIPVPDPLHAGHAVLAYGRRAGADPEVYRYAMLVMSRILRVVLRWRHQVTGLRRAARLDPLTGIANRAQFWGILERLRQGAHPQRVCVLYVDLDGFKEVNDRHGHAVGDRVLAEVAGRISAVLRPGDAVARIGGDEFAVVCADLTADDDATAIADRVLAAFAEPFATPAGSLRVGASVGIACADRADLDGDALLEQADRALYDAKRSGRGGWALAAPA